MKSAVQFPFPDVKPDIEEVLLPIIERAMETFIPQDVEIEVCRYCENVKCQHFMRSVGEFALRKAREELLKGQFIEDSMALFLQYLRTLIEPKEEVSLLKFIKTSKYFSLTQECGDSEAGNHQEEEPPAMVEEEEEELPAPRPVKKKTKVSAEIEVREARPKRNIARITFRAKDVAEPPQRRAVRNIEKRIDNSIGKQPPHLQNDNRPKRNREAVLPPIEDGPEEISAAAYHDLQLAEASRLLKLMARDLPEIERIYKLERRPTFPNLPLPNVTYAQKNIAQGLIKNKESASIFSTDLPEVKDGAKYIEQINKLRKWFALTDKCYAFVGLFKILRSGQGNLEIAYRKVKTTIENLGITNVPGFQVAKYYETIGLLIIKYPKLVFQTRCVNFQKWIHYYLDNKKYLRPENLREHELANFFEFLIESTSEFKAVWKA